MNVHVGWGGGLFLVDLRVGETAVILRVALFNCYEVVWRAQRRIAMAGLRVVDCNNLARDVGALLTWW
jgi:hypothetical protein